MDRVLFIKKLLFFGLILVLSLFFVGGVRAIETPRKLGIAVPYVLDKIDPKAWDEPVNLMVLSNVAYSLVSLSGDDVKLQLAKEFRISQDGTRYTFVLRDSLQFPMDSNISVIAVQKAVDWHIQNKSPGYDLVSSFDVSQKRLAYGQGLGDITVVFQLKSASSNFVKNLEKWILLNVDLHTLMGSYVGTTTMFSAIGPYYLRSNQEDVGVVLEAHPDFFRPGFPMSKVLDFRVYDSGHRALSALRVGAVDIIALPSDELVDSIKDDPILISVPSPLVQRTDVQWKMKKDYWSSPNLSSDKLRTDVVIVRKSLKFDGRFVDSFDLSGVYLP